MKEDSGKNFLRRNLFLILCTVLCLPVFLINIKDSHDWGDDFAQYILQAKNIVEHKPQTQTGYVYADTLAIFAPPAYPAGFPLMLAAPYAWKGNSIRAFNYLITGLLFLLCLVMFWFFRKHFTELTALFLVLIFAYSPWAIAFKTNILSDYPYSLFLLLTVVFYLYGNGSILNFVLTGISCGIMLSIRGVAAVFLLALVLHLAYRAWQNRQEGKPVQPVGIKAAVIFGSTLFVYFILNYVLVHVPTGKFLEFYSHAYQNNSLSDVIVQNLNYYVQVFEAFFDPPMEKWVFVAFVSKSFSLVLLLIGMLYCLLHKRTFIDLLTWIYILLFIVYPYSAGGFRFILPVFPFLVYYMVIGLKQIHMNIHANRKVLIVSGGLFVLLQYQHFYSDLYKYRHDLIHGPQEAVATETFTFIKNTIPETSLVVFKKPKALALYTGRRSTSAVYYQSPEDVKNMMVALGAEYMLVYSGNDADLIDMPLKNYVDSDKGNILIWENKEFRLYKRTGT